VSGQLDSARDKTCNLLQNGAFYIYNSHQVMTATAKSRQGKSQGETLSPLSGHAVVVIERGWPPGFRDEPRPLLSFILRVLDGKHRQMVRQHLEYFLRFNFQIGTPEIEKIQRRLSSDTSLLQCAVDGMISAMREMADMWIDSGKSQTERDVDFPVDRNVEDVLPGRECSLALLIYRSLLRTHPVYKVMRRDGSQAIQDTYPRFDPQSYWKLEDALQAHGAKWAAFYFSKLLDSPFSRHISRCDHCKSYFVYERARLRRVKNGVFCAAHDGQGSMKRTERSREKRWKAAARAVIEWESKHKGTVQPEWVAEQVNKAHGTAFGRRWFSQNIEEIQKRVEALRNTKG